MPLSVEARGVSVTAGFRSILSSVSFSARAGEVLAILGPSGAGKSTLFKALNGISAPSRGQVLYGTKPLYEDYDRFRMKIGYVPQDDILHDALTPFDVLYYTGRLRMPAAEEEGVTQRVEEVLRMVDLSDRSRVRVRRLSGGQRKRVNLGVELMTSPEVLFLDEPTSGLDPQLEEKMMDLFRELARGGRTVFVTTHVTESLDRVDRVLLLCSGKVAFVGRPKAALGFFGVPNFSDIYGRLTAKGPDYWQDLFQRAGPGLDDGPAPRFETAPERPAGKTPPAPGSRPLAASGARTKTADELLADLEREIEEEKRR